MKILTTGLACSALVAAVSLAPATTAFGATPSTGAPHAAATSSRGTDTVQAERSRAGTMARQLALGAKEKLIVKSVSQDKDGTTHVRYERTFAGLRVIGGDIVVHRSGAGAIKGVNVNATGKVAVASTAPAVSAAAAQQSGAAQVSLAGEKASGDLVVWAGKGAPKLAYDVVVKGIRADQTPSRIHTIVDAQSGRTLSSWDDIETGTGRGIYVGTVTIGTQSISGGYQMKDAQGNNTTDLRGATSGTGSIFTDSDDSWGNGSNSDRASAGVDAHYGAEKTFDFYKTVLGRNGIFNNGQGARSRVHYGNGYQNAFWDGTQMTYGDGAGNSHPLTELDVAGHEMSHGVTENTAGLVYTGDAGGLNEATSDIFGTSVEFYANNANDPGDYLIGEEINLHGNGTPLRYQDRPSRDGSSPDCWSSSVKNLDPHYSSGPLNHWFYLTSEGSGSKVINGVSYNSPTCNGKAVTGISRDKASKIWYRALSIYLTSNSTYKDAREAAIRSAKDLYGDGAECVGVATAFDSIAVPAGAQACTGGSGGDPQPTPTGDNLLKNPGFESGAVSWTGTRGPITNNSARAAHSGSWKMWLGGNGTTAAEKESQTVTIPATATKSTLSLWLSIDSDDSVSRAYDTMKVQAISSGTTKTLATYSNLDRTNGYVQKSYDVSAYKGKSVTITFVMSEDRADQTSFVVDDTSLVAQ